MKSCALKSPAVIVTFWPRLAWLDKFVEAINDVMTSALHDVVDRWKPR